MLDYQYYLYGITSDEICPEIINKFQIKMKRCVIFYFILTTNNFKNIFNLNGLKR